MYLSCSLSFGFNSVTQMDIFCILKKAKSEEFISSEGFVEWQELCVQDQLFAAVQRN